MDAETFQSYLVERYQKQIEWYARKARSYRKLYYAFQWPLIVFSAITPVLVVIGGSWQKWLAVIISALVAIGTTALKTFQYHELWINYRTVCETLRKEIYYYRAKLASYAGASDPEVTFVERVEAMISGENTLWVSTASQEQKAGPQKQG
ncbi:MAG TPA: DUF4231 domain-containing protein [Terriglobia bacterium]|nr:DUF4231 domain-containing protein [Terriglobia bacterium]